VITDPYWNDYLLQGLEVVLFMAIAGLLLFIRYRRRQRVN
jgi:hypothetical protein